MEDTWFSREMPVLEALVAFFEEEDDYAHIGDIASKTRLDSTQVTRSLVALDGLYVHFERTMGGGGYVKSVTSAARRAVGQWPTAESLADRLVTALDDAADKTDDEEKKGWLRRTASYFGGAGRDLAVDVAGAAISRSMGVS